MKSQIITAISALILAACGGGGSAAEPAQQAQPLMMVALAAPVTQEFLQPVTTVSDAWQIAADSSPNLYAKPWVTPLVEIDRPVCKSGTITVVAQLEITAHAATSKNRETYLAVMPVINGVSRDDLRLIDTVPTPGYVTVETSYTYRKTLPAEALPAGKLGLDVRKFADDGLGLTITTVAMDVTCSGGN